MSSKARCLGTNFQASPADRASAAEALLAKGADVNAVDYKGRTALSHAACYGSLDCISVLAQHNADAFHIDSDGRTPLDIAEDCSRFEAVNQLKRYPSPACPAS